MKVPRTATEAYYKKLMGKQLKKTKGCKHFFQVIEKRYKSLGYTTPILEEIIMYCSNCGEVKRVLINREENK
jgi:hypothetical protein